MKKFIIILMIIAICFPQKVYAENNLKYGIDTDKINSESSIPMFEKNCGTHEIYVIHIDDEKNIPYYPIFSCILENKTPLISISENCDMDKTAQIFGALDIPFIVEICPLTSSCKLNKNSYLSLFQTSSALFKKYAPKSTILYSFSIEDIEKAKTYFPGRYYADMAGFIFYSNQNNNILEGYLQTKEAYSYFSNILPIIFSRFAVSHFSTPNVNYSSSETEEYIENFYNCIKTEFNKIDTIIYSDRYVSEKTYFGNYTEDYRISEPKELSEKYKNIIRN